jgi:uncharacterized membrane protein
MKAKGKLFPWELFTAFVVFLPLISAISSYTQSRNLLLVVFLVMGLAIFAVALQHSASDDTLMLLIFCFSLTLIFSVAFLSGNLQGYDIHEEYRLFLQVSESGHWTPTPSSLYYSIVSISILPAIIEAVSGLNGLVIFKFLLPILFSIVPVVLFKIYRTILSPRNAFLSVFLLMSYPTFYGEMLQLGRQEIAEVLLVILIWFIVSAKIKYAWLITTILTFGLVMSHYTLAFIYVGIVLLSYLISRVSHRRIEAPIRASLLAIVITFAWFTYVAGGIALFTLRSSLMTVFSGISTGLFSGLGRPAQVMLAVGTAPGQLGALHEMNRAIQILVQLILFVGFIAIVLKKRKSTAESKILPLITFAMLFLGASIVAPFLAGTLQITRIYHIALLFLSPCFMLGIGTLDRLVRMPCRHLTNMNIRTHLPAKQLVAAAILCSYLLFVSGWTWAATMDTPTQLIFDSARILNSTDINVKNEYFDYYTLNTDIAAAHWIAVYGKMSRPICSDSTAQFGVLDSYGEFPRGGPVLPFCYPTGFSHSYIYLREFNAVYGYFVIATMNGGESVVQGSTLQISDQLAQDNRVFSAVAVIYCPVD